MSSPASSPALEPLPADWSGRLLVRGVNWLGDAVMTTPALQRLRQRLPRASITLLTPEKLAGLWHHLPGIDQVMAFSAGESVWSVARRIRGGPGFDLALILPNSVRSALEPWLGGVPRRIGCARPWRNWFLTHAIAERVGRVRMRKLSVREIRRRQSALGLEAPPPSSAHQVHGYLRLAAALGANPDPLPPRLEVAPDEVERAGKTLLAQLPRSRQGPPPDLARLLVLGLNPGAEYGPAKRWPAERFAATALEVSRRLGSDSCVWLVFGLPNDRELCEGIAGASAGKAFNLAGRTSLRELMALLRLCRVLLTNDSGPMHLAAALGTPVVAPFGSTSPELTGPGLPGDPQHRLLKSDAPCAPCFRRACPIDFRCMTALTPERMTESVLDVLGQKG